MLQGPKCKKERRVGGKLFLKAERCQGSKCAVVRNPVKPGYQATKKRKDKGLTEFGQLLLEKQKIQWSYFVDEKYMNKIFKQAKRFKGVTALKLFNSLERRLDSVVYRAGFAAGRAQARHYVSHGHFLVNGRKVTVPSYETKIGDTVSLRPESQKLAAFKDIREVLKRNAPPEWLEVRGEDISAKITRDPENDAGRLPFNFSAVVEYFSR